MINESNPSKFQIWVLAARPKTLYAAIFGILFSIGLII